MPPPRSFDDLDGKERGQKKTDDLRAMTTLGPRTLDLSKRHIVGNNMSRLICLVFGLSLYPLPYFVYAQRRLRQVRADAQANLSLSYSPVIFKYLNILH